MGEPGRRHYLDHASTSPLRPEARAAMVAVLDQPVTADPGRVHTEGRMARAALEEARDQLAAVVGARPREVVLTSGATEAINAAVFGAAHRWAVEAGAAAADAVILAADVEHSAVLDASARHRRVGIEVDDQGRIHPEAVADALARAGAPVHEPAHPGAGVALVHVQWGNHEVGTLQPVAEIAEVAHRAGALVHVDAAQAVGHVAVDLAASGADLLSLSGHKLGGPPGTGALVVRRGLRLPPLVVGGEQERARRGGLENVAGAVGLAAAADAATLDLAQESARCRALTARALEAALAVEGVTAYGDPDGRLPHLVCVGVEGVEAEAVLLALDQAGVAAHSGSACSSESLEPSPVLAAMGVDAERSLRISVGWSTTDADIDAFAAAFPAVVARLRGLRR